MGFIGWIILGGLAGWIASKIMHTDAQQGVIANIVVGIVGAFLGGWIFSMLGQAPVTGFNLYSFFVALIGAIVLIFLYKLVTGRKAN